MRGLRDSRLWVAAVGLMSIACIGYLIGYVSAGSANQPTTLASSISGLASLEYPVSWQSAELPAAYEALASTSHPLVLSRPGRSVQAGLIVGLLDPHESPLPGALVARLTSAPVAEVVTMVAGQAYRYSGLETSGSHLHLTAYAVPVATEQTALEICYARSGAAKALRECEQIAEGLAPQQPRSVELVPYGRLAGVLRSVIDGLLAQRLAIRRQLHSVLAGPETASLATRMAGVAGTAASKLEPLAPLVTNDVIVRLIAALHAVKRAYAAYSQDALSEPAASYPAASKAVYAAEATLGSALENLGLLGY